MKTGDVVPAEDIIAVHSCRVTEDSRDVVTLFDLVGGRTGVLAYPLCDGPGDCVVRAAD